jgi:ATP-dependent Lon protease
VKRGLEIVPAATVDEVLKRALVAPLTPIEWIEPADPVTPVGEKPSDEDVGIVTH